MIILGSLLVVRVILLPVGQIRGVLAVAQRCDVPQPSS